MTIYNVTIKIHHQIHDDWLKWLKTEHIPEVIDTGCFTKATVLRIEDIDDSEGPTYAVQYIADNRRLYDRYIEIFAGVMRQKSYDKWGDQFIAFRSVMKVV